MLHAINKNKTKFYRRYLGDREGNEHKVHEEDEITSTILGPLDFLPVQDVYRFWRRILHSTIHAAFLPNEQPVDVKFELWTRNSASNDEHSIEPDGVVTISFLDERKFILLLELKWRASLSGKDQLHRQWTKFLDESERARALHLFIAPEISAGAQAPNNDEAGGDVWRSAEGSRLVLLPWLRIRATLDEFAKESTPLGRWAKLSGLFLERVGVRRFIGFENLVPQLSLPAVNSPYLFWAQFLGLAACGAPPNLPNPVPSTLFFAH